MESGKTEDEGQECVEDGFTLLARSTDELDAVSNSSAAVEERGAVPAELILSDYAARDSPRLREQIQRLQRENENLLTRLAALEALVLRPDEAKNASSQDDDLKSLERMGRLQRENENLVARLATLEALVFRGDGESSSFLHRLNDRVGEVDRWIVQQERTRNQLIRRHVPCGFVPDHSSAASHHVAATAGLVDEPHARPLDWKPRGFGLMAPFFSGL